MSKQQQEFIFHYPLRHKVVRDLKIVTEQVGILVVEGTGRFDRKAPALDIHERFAVDIEAVRWQGTDIRPVLEVTGQLEEIEEAALRHFARQLEQRWERAA